MKHFAVAGNIGSGKTTLVEKLAQHYAWKPYYELIENPYLDDFYKDMRSWAFHLQVCFLSNKFSQLKGIAAESGPVIQDRTVYEEALVFVKNLQNMMLLSPRDYQTYLDIYNNLEPDKYRPDLLIYLKGSVDKLVSQIHKRGRIFEQNIEPDYIERLNRLYDDWVENHYPGEVLVIDVNEMDFVENDADFLKITALVDEKIARMTR